MKIVVAEVHFHYISAFAIIPEQKIDLCSAWNEQLDVKMIWKETWEYGVVWHSSAYVSYIVD